MTFLVCCRKVVEYQSSNLPKNWMCGRTEIDKILRQCCYICWCAFPTCQSTNFLDTFFAAPSIFFPLFTLSFLFFSIFTNIILLKLWYFRKLFFFHWVSQIGLNFFSTNMVSRGAESFCILKGHCSIDWAMTFLSGFTYN